MSRRVQKTTVTTTTKVEERLSIIKGRRMNKSATLDYINQKYNNSYNENNEENDSEEDSDKYNSSEKDKEEEIEKEKENGEEKNMQKFERKPANKTRSVKMRELKKIKVEKKLDISSLKFTSKKIKNSNILNDDDNFEALKKKQSKFNNDNQNINNDINNNKILISPNKVNIKYEILKIY